MIARSADQLHQVGDLPPTQPKLNVSEVTQEPWLVDTLVNVWSKMARRFPVPKGKPASCRGNKPPLKSQESSSETQ
jgi:hypothetical protein